MPLAIIALLTLGYLVYRDRKSKKRLRELQSQVSGISTTGSVYGDMTSKHQGPPFVYNAVANSNEQYEVPAREWAVTYELPGQEQGLR